MSGTSLRAGLPRRLVLVGEFPTDEVVDLQPQPHALKVVEKPRGGLDAMQVGALDLVEHGHEQPVR